MSKLVRGGVNGDGGWHDGRVAPCVWCGGVATSTQISLTPHRRVLLIGTTDPYSYTQPPPLRFSLFPPSFFPPVCTSMSTFGSLFQVSTFGESHCAGVGCIVQVRREEKGRRGERDVCDDDEYSLWGNMSKIVFHFTSLLSSTIRALSISFSPPVPV